MAFLEKTLDDISSYAADSMYSERYAGKDGLLQAADPSFKLLSILFLIFLTVLVDSIPEILVMMGGALLLAILSRVPLLYFISRVWLFVPLFTVFIAIPALFDFITPGEVLISFNFFGIPLSITREGLEAALTLIWRVATTVSFAVLLTLTTRWNVLMRSLSTLGVPSVFIIILTLTYRYIFYLFTSMKDMILARKSRTGMKQSSRKVWKMYAPLIGALFIHSYETNDRVYMAMKARGFGSHDARKEAGGRPVLLFLFFTGALIAAVVL